MSLSKKYDVFVAGAGPAGLQAARRLAQAGLRVLVAERFDNFEQNNFSSAGTTREMLADFNLPMEVAAATWNKLTLVSARKRHTWRSKEPLGYVLDFAKLRDFLSKDIQRSGGEVWMGHKFKSLYRENGHTEITLEEVHSQEEKKFEARFVVDGTGFQRAVMRHVASPASDYADGLGLEYLIEVPEKDYKADEMVFLIGERWMPKGYSWIFPMEHCRLKVGAGQFRDAKTGELPYPLKHYLEMTLKDYLKLKEYRILDIHGGRLLYSKTQKDPFYQENIIAVGDTVSAVNPLGGEGIRHGMKSGDYAAEAILKNLDSIHPNFEAYEQAMRAYYSDKWKDSLYAGDIFYFKLKDLHIDFALQLASALPVQAMMDIIFYYRFGKGILAAVKKKAKLFF